MILLSVEIEAGDWGRAGDIAALSQRAAEATAAELRDATGRTFTADLLLTDDGAIRELNRAWRGQDKSTNVLSFPAPLPSSGGVRHLGDVALGFETVAGEAAAEGKSLADHAAHLVVHGLLHCLGHDHEREADADAMEAIEIAALKRLGVADPYQGGGAATPR